MLTQPTVGSLFSGIGGMDLGFERAGFSTSWQVEIDPFANRVLAKHWSDVRRHSDVCSFPPDATDWRVDVITGGFPCQDISVAGKGAGIAEGTRSGLWSEYARIVRLLRPRFVVVENVAALLDRGLGRVLGDLAAVGYDAEWGSVPDAAVGAPHLRDRIFVVAHRDGYQRDRSVFADGSPSRHEWWAATQDKQAWDRGFAELESMGVGVRADSYAGARGVLDGIPDRLERLRGIGNAVVPQVAEWIARRLMRFGFPSAGEVTV